ncbi:MAG: DUF2071 domain-containing protein [Planctomycetes bacterium]|nr:DUF2071 domain-containing protein [Planctomycetota bacterium]
MLRGLIDRRILVNYRVRPEVLAAALPEPFRPKLHRGWALAGICLIRLREIRPGFLPAWLGLASENAAHRAAVEWDLGEGPREGVFVWRRDTSSCLNALAGGRVFPGRHGRARFDLREEGDRYELSLHADRGANELALVADRCEAWPEGSIFRDLDEASAFFAAGSLGYSVTADPGRFEGLELHCRRWAVAALRLSSLRSSFFDDPEVFPPGSIEFDCALLMRGIEHEWRGRPDLCCVPALAPSSAVGD